MSTRPCFSFNFFILSSMAIAVLLATAVSFYLAEKRYQCSIKSFKTIILLCGYESRVSFRTSDSLNSVTFSLTTMSNILHTAKWPTLPSEMARILQQILVCMSRFCLSLTYFPKFHNINNVKAIHFSLRSCFIIYFSF